MKADLPRIGWVIHGPLTSRGKTGNSFRVSKRKDVQQDEIVIFDCRDNVNCLVEAAESLGHTSLVVTWEAEDTSGVHPHVPILRIKDITPVRSKASHSQALKDNKFRGIYSAYRGVRQLAENHKVDIIIKIRSDQWVDLEAVAAFITDRWYSDERFSRTLYVPIIFLDRPCDLSDFFIAGAAAHVIDYFEAAIANRHAECHPSVHADLLLKYALHSRTFVPKEARQWHFPLYNVPGLMAEKSIQIFRRLYCESVVPFPRYVMASMLWRGSPMNPEGFADHHSAFHDSWVEGGLPRVLKALESPGAQLQARYSAWLTINWAFERKSHDPRSALAKWARRAQRAQRFIVKALGRVYEPLTH